MPASNKHRKIKVAPMVVTEPVDAYDRRRAAVRESLVSDNISDDERWFLGTCQQIWRKHNGMTTPIEDFIFNLVHAYLHECALTPKEILEDQFADFEENFEIMRRDILNFVKRHPEVAKLEAA